MIRSLIEKLKLFVPYRNYLAVLTVAGLAFFIACSRFSFLKNFKLSVLGFTLLFAGLFIILDKTVKPLTDNRIELDFPVGTVDDFPRRAVVLVCVIYGLIGFITMLIGLMLCIIAV